MVNPQEEAEIDQWFDAVNQAVGSPGTRATGAQKLMAAAFPDVVPVVECCVRCQHVYAAFHSECPYCLMRPAVSTVN